MSSKGSCWEFTPHFVPTTNQTLSVIQAAGFGVYSPYFFNAKPLQHFLSGEEIRIHL